MDVRQLNALVAVAEAGSVTRAAELLHLVQPAVSRQIRMLEDELGVPLFERSRQGMVITDDGRVLIEHARRALRELERAREAIRPADGELHGHVAVGLLHSVADHLAEMLVLQTTKRHPAVRIRVSVGYAGHIADWIDSAEVDLGLLYDIRPTAAVDVHELVEEPLWAVGPPDSGLSPSRPVELAEMAGHPLVLPSPPHALRTMVDRAATTAHHRLTIVSETNSMSVQRRLVAAGLGYTILPAAAVTDELGAGRLTAAPLTDDRLRRRLVLAYPSTRRLGPAVRAVASMLHESVQETARQGAWPLARWIGRSG